MQRARPRPPVSSSPIFVQIYLTGRGAFGAASYKGPQGLEHAGRLHAAGGEEIGSSRPEGTPDHVVVESEPERLLERVREANRGGDVHLVGGPKTIDTFRSLGALDKLGLIVLPLLLADGMRLTPALSTDTGLTLESASTFPGGYVELTYAVNG